MVRHSKLQKQVLSLYRQFLRAGRDKPGFLPRIREEFRTNATIKKTDVMHIEYLCRRAQRQLEQLRDVNTKQLGFFSQTKEDSWLKICTYSRWKNPFLVTVHAVGHYWAGIIWVEVSSRSSSDLTVCVCGTGASVQSAIVNPLTDLLAVVPDVGVRLQYTQACSDLCSFCVAVE